jgi:hypothetical protein
VTATSRRACASGRPQFDNTHYDTEAEAWAWLFLDSDCEIKFAKTDIAHAAGVARDAKARLHAADVRRKSMLARKRRFDARPA